MSASDNYATSTTATLAPRIITEADLEALELGAAVLGTGGGGNPYIGKLRTRELLRSGKKVKLISLHDLPDDALVVSVGGIGAPVVGIEKLEHGDECYQALKAVEAEVGKPISALIPAEIGGANSMEPMLTAAQAGLPVVDADGMGRAFPELQMCTFFIYGHKPAPAAIADDKGNKVVFREVIDMYWLERLARAVTVQMGAAAGYADAPMTAGYLKKYAIPNTVSQALNLGYAIQKARQEKRHPVEEVLRVERGKLVFEGKITDVRRELKGGFAVGKVDLEGFSKFQAEQASIDIQNENLIFWRGERAEVTVPDLIIMLDSDNGTPITTEVLRYGQRVAVLGLPCHSLLRSPEALEVIGPAAFGYDIPYEPLEDS
ncbi:MAG: DUF917 domain-containing protein [Deinococcota bacterium]